MSVAGAQMETAVVEAEAGRIGQAGAALDASWQASRGAISGSEPAIGTGPIAGAFRDGYTASAEHVRTAADAFPPLVEQVADLARQSAAEYRRADISGAAGMPG